MNDETYDGQEREMLHPQWRGSPDFFVSYQPNPERWILTNLRGLRVADNTETECFHLHLNGHHPNKYNRDRLYSCQA